MVDALEGVKISKNEAIHARKDAKTTVIASKCSPLVVQTIGGEFLLKELAVFVPSQGGFVPKDAATQASDGSWVTKSSLAIYESKLAKKRVNKAKVAVAAVTAEAAVAA
jgi:hypothetical protein